MYQKMKNGPDYYQGTKKQEKSDKSKTSKETVLSLNENFGLEVYFFSSLLGNILIVSDKQVLIL